MFLEEHLKKLGLTEKEAKIYLAALELGADTIQNVARKAELKRPTVYVLVDELIRKGLLSRKPMPRGDVFIPENPENLKNVLKERELALGDALPFLRAIYNVEKGKPQVQIYEGINNMHRVYLDMIWKSKTEILFFSSIKKIYEAMPDLLESWLANFNARKDKPLTTREFINPDPIDIEYGLKVVKTGLAQVRVIPKEFKHLFVGTDNAIFEDKLVVVSFEQKLFTTIIQSQAIADTMRALYELAWKKGTPVEEFVKRHPEMRPKNS
ncbi:MAG: hypothetical protein HZC26_02755 [Candidatus Magasanikbacteria bacterium]|nr:hypothetical protein [Candidatus Magasanikbacteria bacterium]